MNTIISKLLLLTLSCLICMPSIHAAASSSAGTSLWKTASQSTFDSSQCTHPLVQLSAGLFAVGRHNELIATSLKTGEPALFKTGTSSLVKHPDYLTNGTTGDAGTVPSTCSLVHPGYIITQKDPKKICLTSEDLSANAIITPVSTTHQSPIFGCARFENTLASVSPWHITLTHLHSKDAPEVIAHKHPKLMSMDGRTCREKTCYGIPLGRFGSDNWMRCIAIKKGMIATGQFDGSIFLWSLPHNAESEPHLIQPRIFGFTESRTVKQIQFTSDGQTIFALNRHGLTKIILSNLIRGFSAKPKESAHFESMFFDEEHRVIYVGTANGGIYSFQLKQGRIEFLTDLSGFSSPDKKINVIQKVGAMLYLGTNGGNLYAYDPNRHPCMQKTVGDDTSAICDLLPTDKGEMIISRQNGTLQKVMLGGEYSH